MDKYEIAAQTFDVIDNQLCHLVMPVSDQETVNEDLPTKPVAKTNSANKFYPNKLTPQQIQKMVEDRLNGMPVSKVCAKYNVTPPTVSYWIKKHSGAPTPVNKKVKDYTCRDCRRSFKSNLGLLDVKCPNCNSLEIENGASEPAIKEE